jgi:hypothetical protein
LVSLIGLVILAYGLFYVYFTNNILDWSIIVAGGILLWLGGRARVSLIDNPVPELYMSPDAVGRVEGYFRDVGAFEESLAKRQSRTG